MCYNAGVMTLGERIRRLRDRLGWSRGKFIAELYQATGLRPSEQSLKNWEDGGPVSATYREVIERYLEVLENEENAPG